MSHLRLSAISSHLCSGKYDHDVKLTKASSETKFVWNPPDREEEIKGGEKITVRSMKEGDLAQCLNLMRARKVLDFAESDITCAMQYHGFTGVVAVNKDGLIIGCLLSMVYRQDVRTLGHGIVHHSYQQRGVGGAMAIYIVIFRPMAGDIGDYEEFLYGYKDKASVYKSGYYIEDTSDSFLRVIGTFKDTLSADNYHTITVKRLEPEHFLELSQYDESVHVINREKFIKAVCFHEASRTYVAYRQKRICGYAVLRRCYISHKIAPLFADSSDVARKLCQRMAQDIQSESQIAMIVPRRNQSAMNIIEENEFSVVDEIWRLQQYTIDKPHVNINYNNVFVMTDCNLSLC